MRGVGARLLLLTLLSSSTATYCTFRVRMIPPHMCSSSSRTEEHSSSSSSRTDSSAAALSASVSIYQGIECLDMLLQKARYSDISSPVLDDEIFGKWCRDLCSRRTYHGSEFSTRVAVREIRRMNREALSAAEARLEIARAEYGGTEAYAEISRLDRQILSCSQAVASMQAFLLSQHKSSSSLNEARKEQIRSVGLGAKTSLLSETLRNRSCVVASTPSFSTYQTAVEELQMIHDRIGLSGALRKSSDSVRAEGLGRTFRGRRFEDFAESVVPLIMDTVSIRHDIPRESLFSLRNVKLGMAATTGSTGEMDCLICYEDTSGRADSSRRARNAIVVKVAGVVEVKKNCDDLGDAFLGYQMPLNWLCGHSDQYKSADFVTRHFTSGHFDREITHNIRGDNNTYIFSRDSFSLLERRRLDSLRDDAGYFIDDLYFITMIMDLEGVSSRASSWCLCRIGDEECFDMELSSASALRALRARVNDRYPFRLSAVDAIKLYKSEGVHSNVYGCSYKPGGTAQPPSTSGSHEM